MSRKAVRILWWAVPFRWIFWFGSIFASVVGAFEVAENLLSINVQFNKFQQIPIAFFSSGIGVIFLTNEKIINQHKHNKNIDLLHLELMNIRSVLTPQQIAKLDSFEEKTNTLSEYGIRRNPASEIKLGDIARLAGRNDEAMKHFKNALEEFTNQRDLEGQAEAMNGMGKIKRTYGMLDDAKELHNQSLELWRKSGRVGKTARALSNLAMVEHRLGNTDRAHKLYSNSLAICKESGDERSEAIALNNLGVIALEKKQFIEAEEFFSGALNLRKKINSPDIYAVLNNMGDLEFAKGNIQIAKEFFTDALELSRELGIRRSEGINLVSLAEIALTGGQMKQAYEFLDSAQGIFDELGDLRRISLIHKKRSEIAADEGNFALSKTHQDEYNRIQRELKIPMVSQEFFDHFQ